MDCALWLNRRKVYSAKEIRENFDAASLFGYFAAGSLVEWLREHGGADYADKLERLSPDAPDIIGKIAAVFDGKSVGYKTLGGADKGASGAVSGGGQCSFRGKNGSAGALSALKNGSFGFGSFGMGSFGSFSFDLFGEVKNGSFIGRKLPDFLANLDEYDRIMLISLYGCPLNQFGYGIHNI